MDQKRVLAGTPKGGSKPPFHNGTMKQQDPLRSTNMYVVVVGAGTISSEASDHVSSVWSDLDTWGALEARQRPPRHEAKH